MFEYVVVSAPHSGTRFTLQFLQLLGVKPVRREHVNIRTYSKEALAEAPIEPSTRLIIPQRDPGNVWISNNQRRTHFESQPHYKPISVVTPLERIVGQYERLRNLMEMYPDQYRLMPIDVEIPSDYWRDLTTFLTIPHERMCDSDVLSWIHKWPKVGAWDYKYSNIAIPPEVEEIRKEWGYSRNNNFYG